MKKYYFAPSAELTLLAQEDVIATSLERTESGGGREIDFEDYVNGNIR